jgi:hypothetical protein
VAATSTTSQADKDALENVIELLRKRRADEATQGAAAISDPVARKLAEWLILRSESNNVTVERYRGFISANPSWPSQSFLRRRLEAALWDDKREDAAIWSWFENESPISAKGRLALAKVMIARFGEDFASGALADQIRAEIGLDRPVLLRFAEWLAAFKGGPASAGSFLNAANCSEAIALAGAAIRYSRKIFNENRCAPALQWDRENMKFTNAGDANQFLKREYRDGWNLTPA